MNQMGEGSSGPSSGLPSGAGDGEAERTFSDRDPVIRPRPDDPANPWLGPLMDTAPCQPPTYIPPHQPSTYIPPHQPSTYIPPHQAPTDAAPHQAPTYIPLHQAPTETAPHQPPMYIPPHQPPTDVARYGPGVPTSVPASQAGPKAERIWRTGRLPEPPRGPARLRRLFGSALTVILLAASGVVLYLHFHHAPFHVSGVAITQSTKNGCEVDVTGGITTNGAAGKVSYQWVFPRRVPRPLSQSVVAGQQTVYVTAAVEGQGHGSASQTVTLQVLGPDQETASTGVVVSCR